MSQVVKNEKSLKDILNGPETKKRFEEMLGNKAAGFIVSVMNAVSNNDSLRNAEKNSVLFSAAVAASLDLPINENLGFAYIVPYKKNGIQFAQFQMGYKGYIQLAMRSGQFKTIAATEVYEGQILNNDPLRGVVFNWDNKTSDKVVGYVSFFQLLNGFEKTFYMTKQQMELHARTYSKSFSKDNSIWRASFDKMALKTVLKLNLSKFAPMSIEMQKAVTVDQGIINDWEGNAVEYPDNSSRKPDVYEIQIEQEKKRVLSFCERAQSEEDFELILNSIDGDEVELISLVNEKLSKFQKKK